MNEEKMRMISLIADNVFNENFKSMSAEEFFEISECELEELILPHLNYIELMDNVKAELVTYFDY